MKFSSTNLKWFNPFIILLIIAHVYSCSSWKIINQPVEENIEQEKPKIIEVETIYGKKINLKNPLIAGDSLFGIYVGNNLSNYQSKNDSIYIPLKDIMQIKQEKVNPVVLFGLGVILVGMIILGESLKHFSWG